MTLYPKVRNAKKDNFVIIIMLFISIITISTCTIINLLTFPNFLWCLLVAIGIIYSWITVMYSIRRNINIASNVMVQLIAISVLVIGIDFIIGYTGWAINLAIPIIIMIANITTMVLTIVSIHRYFKYAIYQLIIFVLSMIPILIYVTSRAIIIKPIFTIIASTIAVFSFIISLILCGKSIVEELNRRLHM